jgi:threonyl-tRNA synthetase
MRGAGLRADADLSGAKIGAMIRGATLEKIPYILVVGDKEKAAGAVAVRARGNQDLGAMSLEAFSRRIAEDIANKR